jgi:hypothetical protein
LAMFTCSISSAFGSQSSASGGISLPPQSRGAAG